MRGGDLLRYAAMALVRHRLRSGLSLLGVAIGVSAVVLLCALGQGARTYVEGQFNFLGSTQLAVFPGKVETTGGVPGFGGVPNDLTLDDAVSLQRGVPGVAAVAPVSLGNEVVSHGDRSRQVLVIGSTSEMYKVHELALEAGAFLPAGEMERGDPVAVLGTTLARELFPGQNPVGQVVRVGSWRMRVIGVLKRRGMHIGVDVDEVCYVPVATAMRMLDRSSLFRIAIKLHSMGDRERVERRALEIIRERHGEEDVTIVTPDAVIASLGNILTVLSLALAGIAAISLSVAGIGIMNVMLVSVSERTAEVGLLKAVGARGRQILSVFLAEAVALSLLGGVVGVAAAGLAARALTASYPEFPIRPPGWSIAAALGVSVLTGAVFGVLPARRATRLDPVAALART